MQLCCAPQPDHYSPVSSLLLTLCRTHMAPFNSPPQLIPLMSSWPSTTVIHQCMCVLPYKACIPRHVGNAVTKERSVLEGGTWMWRVEDVECIYFLWAFLSPPLFVTSFLILPHSECFVTHLKAFPAFHWESAIIILTLRPDKT